MTHAIRVTTVVLTLLYFVLLYWVWLCQAIGNVTSSFEVYWARSQVNWPRSKLFV